MSDRILRAMVTGASAGIGHHFAVGLAEREVELVLVARRAERLDELARQLPGRVDTLPADLTDPTDLARVVARLQATDEPIDLLVNNAGGGAYGSVLEQDPLVQTRMIALNVQALTTLTTAAATAMSVRGHGGIINVGSIAGAQPGPGGAVYSATKSYVHAFTQAVQAELATQGVQVMLLVPGVTATEFHDQAGVDRDALPSAAVMEAEQVVEAALDAFAAGTQVCVPGAANRLSMLGAKLAPTALSRRIAAQVHERMTS